MTWRIIIAAGGALFVSACGGGTDSPAGPGLEGAAAHGKALFEEACAICHNAAPADAAGIARTGPDLFGVFGAPAGRLDYAYSSRLRNSGLVWDEPTLEAFLASPQKTIPGNRMSYAGEPDAANRKAIIDYLKTLH